MLLDFTQLFPTLVLYKQTKWRKTLQYRVFLALSLNCKGQNQPATHMIWLCYMQGPKTGIYFPYLPFGLQQPCKDILTSENRTIHHPLLPSALLKHAIIYGAYEVWVKRAHLVRELIWIVCLPAAQDCKATFSPAFLYSRWAYPFLVLEEVLAVKTTWCPWG